MKMKRVTVFLSIIIFSLFLILLISFNKKTNTKLEQNKIEEKKTEHQENSYTIKSYNKQIALFVNNQDEPKEIYDIFLENLPDKDIERLNKGIIAKTEEEAYLILEDYR